MQTEKKDRTRNLTHSKVPISALSLSGMEICEQKQVKGEVDEYKFEPDVSKYNDIRKSESSRRTIYEKIMQP